MDTPSAAYKGDGAYVFVCYAHKDKSLVYPEIAWLQEQGVNVWYDEGISPGHEWSEELGQAINDADRLIFFVTPGAAASRHCRNEIHYAQNRDTPIIAVHLKETHLPAGLELSLGSSQAILAHASRATYRAKLLGVLHSPSAVAEPGRKHQPTRWKAAVAATVVGLSVAAAIAVWWVVARDYPEATVDAPRAVEKSVAVLPFTDMSAEGDQQFFGDGIAEELLDELTRLEGLRVASRISSFGYGNQGQDIRKIGEALNVATVLTGSVRRSGDHLRVTARLTSVENGFHLWSQTFDREVTDVFAIQDEIAGAVAGTLGVTLGVGDVNAFSGAGTTNVEAYQAYLRAMQLDLLRQSGQRMRLLERAVELDPDYAAAWAALGLTIGATMWISPVDEAPEILGRAMPIVQRAVRLNPGSSFAYDMLATLNYATMDWIGSEEYYARALEIVTDGETLDNYANLMMRTGRSTRAIRYQQRASVAERNPMPPGNSHAALALGRTDGALKLEMGGVSPAVARFLVAVNSGQLSELRRALENLSPGDAGLYELARRLREVLDSPAQVLSRIESTYRDAGVQWPAKHHDSALLAAFFGDPEFAFEAIAHEARLMTVRYGALWYPVMTEVRKLPAFEELMTEVNLVEYWRTYGWSDHCRSLGEDDFECF